MPPAVGGRGQLSSWAPVTLSAAQVSSAVPSAAGRTPLGGEGEHVSDFCGGSFRSPVSARKSLPAPPWAAEGVSGAPPSTVAAFPPNLPPSLLPVGSPCTTPTHRIRPQHGLCAQRSSKCFTCIYSLNLHNNLMGKIVTIPTLQMRNPRHSEVKITQQVAKLGFGPRLRFKQHTVLHVVHLEGPQLRSSARTSPPPLLEP